MRNCRLSVLAPLTLVLGIGAALGQTATVDPAAAPGVSDVARVDGSYSGAFETKMAPHHGCGAGHDHVMVIKNGRVTMSYSATMSFEGEIGASGAITAQTGGGRITATKLSGALSGDVVTGETWNDDCGYRFSLKRRD
jgi:hypothetical protein